MDCAGYSLVVSYCIVLVPLRTSRSKVTVLYSQSHTRPVSYSCFDWELGIGPCSLSLTTNNKKSTSFSCSATEHSYTRTHAHNQHRPIRASRAFQGTLGDGREESARQLNIPLFPTDSSTIFLNTAAIYPPLLRHEYRHVPSCLQPHPHPPSTSPSQTHQSLLHTAVINLVTPDTRYTLPQHSRGKAAYLPLDAP